MTRLVQPLRSVFLAGALWSLSGSLPVGAAEPAVPSKPEFATLMLLWTPQSQFAGYYVALEKGFFRKRGLEVTLLRGGPDRDQVQDLKEGRTEFTLLWLPTALSARAQGEPILHLGQVVNRSNLAIVGWKDRGVQSLKDLDGRRVSIWGGSFRPAFTTFFRAQGVKPDILTQNFSINLFLLRGVDACSVMRYNEYHMLYQCGVERHELTTFFLSDYDCPLPEDGLYCMEKTFRERPAVCRALVEASMEGWRYAAEHREEALDIVMKQVRQGHIPANRSHMRWMLDTMIDSIFPARPSDWQVGLLNREAYQKTVAILKQAGLIRKELPLDSFSVQEDCVRAP